MPDDNLHVALKIMQELLPIHIHQVGDTILIETSRRDITGFGKTLVDAVQSLARAYHREQEE
jgi:hypothetical protein